MGKGTLALLLTPVALLLALGVLLLVLLLSKLKIRLLYGEESRRIEVGVLFLRFPIPSSKKKKEKEKAKKGEKGRKKKKKKKGKKSGEGGKRPALRGEEIPFLLRTLLALVRGFPYKKAEITLRELHLTLATGDAAKTALLYSGAMQTAAALFALFDKAKKFEILREDSLSLTPDFLGESSTFSLDLLLRMRIGSLLLPLLKILLRQIREREKEKE